MKELPQRFIDKVDKTDRCWNWIGANTPKGYGIFTVNKKNIYAHRYIWSFYYGEIPKGMVICHKCDNPSCVKLGHLFMGTQTENLADMKMKGRSAKGDKHRSKKHPQLVLKGEQIGTSKLTSNDISEIRKLYKPGKPGVKSENSLSGLAEKYGVSHQQISRIVNNERWAWK